MPGGVKVFFWGEGGFNYLILGKFFQSVQNEQNKICRTHPSLLIDYPIN